MITQERPAKVPNWHPRVRKAYTAPREKSVHGAPLARRSERCGSRSGGSRTGTARVRGMPRTEVPNTLVVPNTRLQDTGTIYVKHTCSKQSEENCGKPRVKCGRLRRSSDLTKNDRHSLDLPSGAERTTPPSAVYSQPSDRWVSARGLASSTT